MSRTRLFQDLQGGLVVAVGSVLLGAPAGLLWAALSPRAEVTVSAQGLEIPDLEQNKSFIAADGSYFLVMVAMGVVCGVLAFWLARRWGPWTVMGLVIGGSVAALVAISVGLMPGAKEAINAVTEGSGFNGVTDLYLGRLTNDDLSMRAVWAFVGWPAAACLAFLTAATVHPYGLD